MRNRIDFKNCVLISIATREADYEINPVVYEINNPKNATFQITDTKLYVPVVTLSKENDTKLLEQLKSGFKRTIKWNKYRSQMTIQPQNNNLNYLIDPTFTNANNADYLFCLFQEIIILITDTLIQIIMYQKLKLMTSTFWLMEKVSLICQ